MPVTVAAPDAAWGVEFAAPDGTGAFVRLLRVGDRCWYWAYVVGPDIGLVVVRDHDVPRPRRDDLLEVRADALWAELVCETPGEHWGIALEAFGVALDGPGDALPRAGAFEIGERVAIGLDLEWEVGDGLQAPFGTVRGELLLERARIAIDAPGVLRDGREATAWPDRWCGAWCVPDHGAGPRWIEPRDVGSVDGVEGLAFPGPGTATDGCRVQPEVLAVAPVPLGTDAGGHESVLVRVLTTVHVGSGMTGTGWLEMLQSRALTGSSGSVGPKEHA